MSVRKLDWQSRRSRNLEHTVESTQFYTCEDNAQICDQYGQYISTKGVH